MHVRLGRSKAGRKFVGPYKSCHQLKWLRPKKKRLHSHDHVAWLVVGRFTTVMILLWISGGTSKPQLGEVSDVRQENIVEVIMMLLRD